MLPSLSRMSYQTLVFGVTARLCSALNPCRRKSSSNRRRRRSSSRSSSSSSRRRRGGSFR
jgi:hypothetical protein